MSRPNETIGIAFSALPPRPTCEHRSRRSGVAADAERSFLPGWRSSAASGLCRSCSSPCDAPKRDSPRLARLRSLGSGTKSRKRVRSMKRGLPEGNPNDKAACARLFLQCHLLRGHVVSSADAMQISAARDLFTPALLAFYSLISAYSRASIPTDAYCSVSVNYLLLSIALKVKCTGTATRHLTALPFSVPGRKR
jgi:hypothetical protein